MDHLKDSENVIMHSILCVKLEPFDEDEDCTQNLDPLQPDSNVHTKVELLQDFKTEIESVCRDQGMNELIQENTGTKIEEINIKTEYIGDEASMDEVLDSRGIIEDDNSLQNQLGGNNNSRRTEHGCIEISKQTGEKNATKYKVSQSCEPHSSIVIKEEPTNNAHAFNVTSPANHSRARSDTCSSGVDVPGIHNHSTSEEEGSKQSSYICDVCDIKFKNLRRLISHRVVHTDQKPYICDVCEKGFSQSSDLVRHKRIHTGQKPYVCDICNKGFTTSSNLVAHKHTHYGQKSFVCDICKKGFTHSSNLVAHKHIHTGQKPYVCHICENGFSQMSSLIEHKRIHTGQKPYICDICQKGFTRSSTLVRHKRIHTGQKPYMCDICKRGFSDSSNLIAHKRTHSGEKPYVCDTCTKGFSQSSSLVSHKRTQHGQQPSV